MLVDALRAVRLDLNAKREKSSLWTRHTSKARLVSSLRPQITLPGDLQKRMRITLNERMRSAWGKFHLLRTSLLNRHVCLSLRLRLFDAVVSPSATYGMSAAPIRAGDFICCSTTPDVETHGRLREGGGRYLGKYVPAVQNPSLLRSGTQNCSAQKRALHQKLEHPETA